MYSEVLLVAIEIRARDSNKFQISRLTNIGILHVV